MKMTTYKIIARAKKKGKTVICGMCGKPWVCNLDDRTKDITCGYCLMGLVDSLPEAQIEPKKRYFRVPKKINRLERLKKHTNPILHIDT